MSVDPYGMELVTGATGSAHITSSQVGRFNMGVVGDAPCVFDTGERLRPTFKNATTLTIGTGDLMFAGRHVCFDEPVDLELESGASGLNRIDLVALVYECDASTGNESVHMEVVKGTATPITPTAPVIENAGSMVDNTANKHTVPLYSVRFSGIVPEVAFMPEVVFLKPTAALQEDLETPFKTARIADKAVTGAKLADRSVGNAKMADNAVSTRTIQNGHVTHDKLGAKAVKADKIADQAITSVQMANDSVVQRNIKDGNVTTAKIHDKAVTTAKLDDKAVTPAKLAVGAIAAGSIATGAVETAKIKDGAVTNAKLGAKAVTGAKMADKTVTATQIADGAVTSAKIANGSIEAVDIKAGSITGDRIAANTITSGRIAKPGVYLENIGGTALTRLERLAHVAGLFVGVKNVAIKKGKTSACLFTSGEFSKLTGRVYKQGDFVGVMNATTGFSNLHPDAVAWNANDNGLYATFSQTAAKDDTVRVGYFVVLAP